MFARAVEAIGAPAAIAVMTLLDKKRRRDIIRWLLLLEHIVRKLLLAEAASLPQERPNGPQVTFIPLRGMYVAPPPPPVAKAGKRARRALRLDPDHPETWPARFALALPRNPLLVPDARAPRIRALWGPSPPPPPPPPPRAPRIAHPEETPQRLARRLEALRRVLADPLPHARRLALILKREVRRFPEIVTRYALAPARTSFYDPADQRLGVHAYTPTFEAPPKFRDSS